MAKETATSSATSTQLSPPEKRRSVSPYQEISDSPCIKSTTLQDTFNWCSKTFGALLEDSSTHDIVFKTSDGGCVGAHRAMVSAGSPVFRAMLYGSMRESSQKEIDLPTTDTETLTNLLRFLYTGQVNVNSKCIIHILDAAHYFNITTLETILVDFVRDSLEVTNVFFFVDVATTKNFNRLLEECLRFMYNHAGEVTYNENFKKLSSEVIHIFCKSSNLNIKELDLFLAVVKWYRYHEDKIPETVVKTIFQEIRYPLIPKSDLVYTVRPTKMADSILYTAALEYHLFPDTYEGPQSQVTSRNYQPQDRQYTNITPECMQVYRNPDEGIVMKRIVRYGSHAAEYGLCTIQVYPTKWQPVYFNIALERFASNCISLVTRSYAVSNPVISSANVTGGINITSLHSRSKVNGNISIRGGYIVTTVGGVSKKIVEEGDIYLCVHMCNVGDEIVFTLT